VGHDQRPGQVEDGRRCHAQLAGLAGQGTCGGVGQLALGLLDGAAIAVHVQQAIGGAGLVEAAQAGAEEGLVVAGVGAAQSAGHEVAIRQGRGQVCAQAQQTGTQLGTHQL